MRIVISGTVGVGKSTISKKLQKALKERNIDAVLYSELVKEDNPYLDAYYKDPNSWSFFIQMDFLFKRFKNLLKANQDYYNNKVFIFDRHFLDDYVFTNHPQIISSMTKENFEIYQKVNAQMMNKMHEQTFPDLFILLKADFNEILKRVSKRGREEEKIVDEKYWLDLYNIYYENEKIFEYLKKKCPFIYGRRRWVLYI